MSRHQNPEPHDHDDPNFRAALAMVIGLCAAALLLRWAINDGASILGWEILPKITLGELAIAIVTLCYVVVASFQWDAMRRMLRITRESNALTLRAWAAVDGWEFKLAPDATTTLRIALENVGRLPVVDGIAAGSYTQILEESETVKWPVSIPKTDDSIHTSLLLLVERRPSILTCSRSRSMT